MRTERREPEICTTYVFRKTVEADLRSHIQAEFRDLPGLRLSVEQGERLWSVDHDLCGRVLDELVVAGFLRRDNNHLFARAFRRSPSPPRRAIRGMTDNQPWPEINSDMKWIPGRPPR
jgi:hypothetical protein